MNKDIIKSFSSKHDKNLLHLKREPAISVKVISNFISEGIQVAVKVNSFSLAVRHVMVDSLTQQGDH